MRRRSAKLVRSTDRRTIGRLYRSYAAYLPGQRAKFFGVLHESEDKVHFAGEHTSVCGQGFLNGGVETGSRAAAEALMALGKPLPQPLIDAFVRRISRG